MKIKFKDGKEIKFIKIDNMMLSESVIWEETDLHASLDNLRKLKAKINRWFKKNAPKKIRERYDVRLPLSKEIEPLSFKDQIAYKEGKTDEIADYFLGDEDDYHPKQCVIHYFGSYDRFYRNTMCYCRSESAIRLCLEKR